MNDLFIFADGSCWNGYREKDGNRYQGINAGAGVHIISEKEEKNISVGSFCSTTNIQMEMLSVFLGLRYAKEYAGSIHIYNDCKYVVHGTKEVLKCVRSVWGNMPGANRWLWNLIYHALYDLRNKEINVYHVKGHQSKRSKCPIAQGNHKAHDLAYVAGKSKCINYNFDSAMRKMNSFDNFEI